MESFAVVAIVSSDDPDAVQPVLERLVVGSVVRDGDELRADGTAEGDDARDANRRLLSSLRRVERRTRLRAEWTDGTLVHRFFDFVPKGTTAVAPPPAAPSGQ